MGGLASSLAKSRSDESTVRSEEVMNEDEETEVSGVKGVNLMVKKGKEA